MTVFFYVELGSMGHFFSAVDLPFILCMIKIMQHIIIVTIKQLLLNVLRFHFFKIWIFTWNLHDLMVSKSICPSNLTQTNTILIDSWK